MWFPLCFFLPGYVSYLYTDTPGPAFAGLLFTRVFGYFTGMLMNIWVCVYVKLSLIMGMTVISTVCYIVLMRKLRRNTLYQYISSWPFNSALVKKTLRIWWCISTMVNVWTADFFFKFCRFPEKQRKYFYVLFLPFTPAPSYIYDERRII